MIAISFLAGVAAATFMGAAIFFVKFWLASRDRFFLLFACSCVLLSAERVWLTTMLPDTMRDQPPEAHAWVYMMRMLAYVLILIAVINRNRSRTGPLA